MLKLIETNVARIKVVGVGGAGNNAVNTMVKSGLAGVEFIAINTDQMALDNSLADIKIPIGGKITKGLGAGARPERGFQAIQEDRQAVADAIDGADMVFITAGMGGGTGTGAAPVVAEIAKEKGILSVAVVTRPFIFEGPIREKNSRAGFDALRKNVDTIIVIQNQKLLSVSSKNTQVAQAFRLVDDVLTNAVRGICDIILHHGSIQVDFADVKTVMENGGDALMGTGVAEGEGRALAAAERAIHSPLLDDIDIAGASGVLVNITHCEGFGIHELSEVMSYIHEAVGEQNQPNIIFGHVQDDSPEMEGKVAVTVIAAGFHKDGNALLSSPSVLPVNQREAIPQIQPAPVAAPVMPQWEQYSQQAETAQMAAYHQAPTMPMQQMQAAPMAPTMVAPTMVAPAMVPVQELPNPFTAPYIPEMQPSLAQAHMDLRRMPPTEEVELRAYAPQAPQRMEQPVHEPVVSKADMARFDALCESPRSQPAARDTHGQSKVTSRNTASVSIQEYYNQPMEDDQDRDIPAFLRNSF